MRRNYELRITISFLTLLRSYGLTVLRSYGLLCLFIGCLFCSAQAQTDYFYSLGGQKETLTIRNNMVLIRCTPKTDKEKWIAQSDLISACLIDEHLILGTINPLKTNLNTLKRDPNIADVIYVLEDAEGRMQTPSNTIFMRMRDKQSPQQFLDYSGFTTKVKEIDLIDQYHEIYLVTLNIPLGDILSVCRDFYETGVCEMVEPSFFRTIEMCSANPHFPKQWGLHNINYPGIDINALGAWQITKGDPDIKIAVIDCGVQLDHPDLEDNLTLGYDAIYNQSGGGYSYENYHGTICAGVIGAVDNEIGIIGVAPQCKIVPIRMGYSLDNLDWYTSDTWKVRAINYAWETAKVDVISLSWAFTPSSAVQLAIENAVTHGRDGKGCVFVAASGNVSYWKDYPDPGIVVWPARLPDVLAVGGVEKSGHHYREGCYGNFLDVVAPALDVYTTTIGSRCDYYEGTSLACPHVAGIAALMLSVNPCLTQEEVRKIIALSCEKIESEGSPIEDHQYTYFSPHKYGRWNYYMGYGLPNAQKAVMYAQAIRKIHTFDVPGTITIPSNTIIELCIHNAPSSNWFPELAFNGGYYAKRYEIRATVTYDRILSPVVEGVANGFSIGESNYENSYIINTGYFMEPVSVSETSAIVRTYVYEVIDPAPGKPRWIPAHPDSVRFHFSVMYDTLYRQLYLYNKVETSKKGYHAIDRIVAAGDYEIPSDKGGEKVICPYIVQSGANVSFHAGKYIRLLEGFSAEYGSLFYAYIDPFFICEFVASASAKGNGEEPDLLIGDYSVAKTDEDVVIERDAYLKLYPNPASNEVTVEYFLNRSELVEVTLHDNFGKMVYKLKNRTPHDAGVYKITLNNVALPTGLYLCTLKTENNQITEKLIIVK